MNWHYSGGMKRFATALFVLIYSLPLALNAAVSAPSCTPGHAVAGEAGGHGPCCSIAALAAACAFACQPTVLQTHAPFDPALGVSLVDFSDADDQVSGRDTQPPDPPPRHQISAHHEPI